MNWINDLSLRGKFLLLLAVLGVLLGGVSYFVIDTISLTRVNGPLYTEIIKGKDLTADILPPPAFLMEAYLLIHEMLDETDPAEFAKNMEKLDTLQEQFEARNKHWADVLEHGKMRDALVDKAHKHGVELFTIIRQEYIPTLKRGDHAGASRMLEGRLRDSYRAHLAAVEEVVGLASAWTAEEEKNVNEIVASRSVWNIAMLVGLLGLVAVLNLYTAQIIRKPLAGIKAMIDNADLNTQLEGRRKDEIGDLQRSFNTFVGTIRASILRVHEGTSSLASATSEITSSTEEMAAGAQEQSTQSAEVAAAVGEMAATIGTNSETAQHAVDTAEEARVAAMHGRSVVTETMEGMKRITTVVGQSSAMVEKLGKTGDQIGEIISVIDDIADQTNLLALNAAIEAARAGDQGRGFAVVADEVRRLAERTTNATKEIANVIKQVQRETAEAVASMEQGTREVKNGEHLVTEADASLQQILGTSDRVKQLITQIAAASQQQSTAAEQIARNVTSITSVTNETALGIQQIARASEDLDRLAGGLRSAVDSFNIQGAGSDGHGHNQEHNHGHGRAHPHSGVSVRTSGALVETHA
jgi:methyl-accepting chemotaxis protein